METMKIVLYGIVVLLLAGCSSSQRLVEKDTATEFTLSRELREVLYYASLAPNGHNTQMWKVGVSGDGKTLNVYLDSSRLLPVVDPEGRESLISAGAFLENLRQALGAYGFTGDIEIPGTIAVQENPLVASVTVTGGSAETADPEILKVMEIRHTDKSKYLDRPLDAGAVERLEASVPGTLRIYTKGTEEFGALRDLTMEANVIQSSSPAARAELAEWLRFSDDEAARTADGLPAEQLGLSGIVKKLYYLTTDREKAASEKFGKTSINTAEKQLYNCAGFFVVTGGHTPRGYVQAGMDMEAVWLRAAAEGISLHPMSQALEETETREKLPTAIPGGEFFQMVMRAGYVKDYGENNRIRRPLREFVFLEP
ncbi:Acg family FMN-binding oxidoreductase [Breznakiella homolactica]|uniref:Nitroreductase family protein n=1 Tax=Breznakiella homolactica TaxID=2798577 RepID=A0A7T8BAY6_9SPIR|nr:hypothetical protein [Breznakiella homolactica]QQO09977.1 hypothetical protein JFL75_03425 [Breznakiella homolactica]